MRKILPAVACIFGLFAGTAAEAPAQTTISLWSHWADEQAKVAFVEEAARRFEAKNSGVRVRLTWYQKGPLNAALQSALRARQGPDIFYADPFQTEYIENKLIVPLDGLLRTENLEDWAKAGWTHDGKLWALPLETQSVELYYNVATVRRFGVTLPAGGQLGQTAFLDLVRRARASGATPIVVGVGDRDYPGAYILAEMLLQKLGPTDYGKLLGGELSYRDPRVVSVFTFVRQLADEGAFPRGMASLKLGESHAYFYGSPGGLMLPMGSFYPSRAFNPPDKGGQPEGFPLGLMNYPVPDQAACPECKTYRVGGSYVVSAFSRNPRLAAGLLNEMAEHEMALMWLGTVLGQTGAKVDVSKLSTRYAAYFKDLAEASNGRRAFVGMPLDHLRGACLEAYKQVMNVGLPAGLVSVDAAVQEMDKACFKPRSG